MDEGRDILVWVEVELLTEWGMTGDSGGPGTNERGRVCCVRVAGREVYWGAKGSGEFQWWIVGLAFGSLWPCCATCQLSG